MKRIPVILIFDVGKTNKKLLLFNEHYEVVHEEQTLFDEISDEDGFPCENIDALTKWILTSYRKWIKNDLYEVRAVNFSAYGASFVLTDESGIPCLPMYNYLKPFPEELAKKFYEKYGGEKDFAVETASPLLGSLNSGLQLYRLSTQREEDFKKVKYALHLPQYLSYVLTKNAYSDATSLGCHTALWNFTQKQYHEWVSKEGILEKLPPIKRHNKADRIQMDGVFFGIGLHDSSAALIPYLKAIRETFLLISTGTWCVSLNPFNQTPLTKDELDSDCLFYLSYEDKPVKAARLFSGNEHAIQLKRLIEYFQVDLNAYKKIKYNPHIIKRLTENNRISESSFNPNRFAFSRRRLEQFESFEEAYHQLIIDLVNMQVQSTGLVLKGTTVKNIFVDGGFSNNDLFLQLLANRFPTHDLYAASVAHGSALGAAIVMHHQWNSQDLPEQLVNLRKILPI